MLRVFMGEREDDLVAASPLNERCMLVNVSFADLLVGVDSSIAQERPMGSLLIDERQVNVCDKHLFLVHTRFGDDLSRRIRNKTLAPELDSVSSVRCLEACPIRYRNEAAISDGVAALNCLPGRVLPCAVFFLFGWMPADCRRIEEDFGAAQSSQASAFGIPLVPADQYPDRGVS